VRPYVLINKDDRIAISDYRMEEWKAKIKSKLSL
jgi:hypothetical protein